MHKEKLRKKKRLEQEILDAQRKAEEEKKRLEQENLTHKEKLRNKKNV